MMSHTKANRHARRARSTLPGLQTVVLYSAAVLAACPPQPIFLPVDNCTINLPNQPTIHSWGARISVSSSSSSSTLQYLCGVPSTVTNTTFYTTSLLCSDDNIRAQNLTYAQCLSRRGGGLAVSSSGQTLGPDALQTASTASLNTTDPGWKTIMRPDEPFPAAVRATLHLHGRDSITMTAGLIESGTNHTTTHVSLGDESVLLSALLSAGRITARTFGFDAGSQSYASPRPGGLVLGGWDDGARTGTEVRFPMADYKENHQLNGKRTCPLQVTVASMVLRPAGGDGGDDYPLGIEPAHPQQACLEMYDNYPRLPSGVIGKIKEGFEFFTGSDAQPIRYAAVDPTAAPSASRGALLRQLDEMYIPEPGLIYPSSNLTARFNGSLVIILAQSNFTVEIPVQELFNPLRGIARDGTRTVNQNFSELAVYQDPAPEDAAVLGKVFLSRAYLYVDYDKGEFTLTQSGTTGKTILVATGSDGSCGGAGWTRVTIALVAVLAVVGVALLAGLGWWLLMKRRRDRTSGNRTTFWPWWPRRRVNDEPIAMATDRQREDLPEVNHGLLATPTPPRPEMNQVPPQLPVEDIPLGGGQPTILSQAPVPPRSPSDEEVGGIPIRQRYNSFEVQGSSPLDPPMRPDGQHPELYGDGEHPMHDSPRALERVDYPHIRASLGAQRHIPAGRWRQGSGSTATDMDPLHLTRTD